MKNFTFYTFEDFILDESFNNYALNASDKDIVYWKKWLRENHANIDIANEACKCIQSIKFRKSSLPKEFKNNEWYLLSQKLQLDKKQINKRRHITRIWEYAAAVILLIGLLNAFYFRSSLFNLSEQITYTEINVPKGQIKNVLLPDSTLVFINSDTKLKYDNNFGKKNRQVYLEGEAYFDVTYNSKKPFIVHASEYDIKVLGTAFNISAYSCDNIHQTSLERGKIVIIDKARKESTLMPNETHLLIRNKMQFKTYKVEDITIFSSWKNGKILFRNQTFKSITKELERTHNIHLRINNKEIENLRYTGEFSRNDSIQKILEIMKLTTEFNYELKKETIEIN